jgi:hypothetical protein
MVKSSITAASRPKRHLTHQDLARMMEAITKPIGTAPNPIRAAQEGDPSEGVSGAMSPMNQTTKAMS